MTYENKGKQLAWVFIMVIDFCYIDRNLKNMGFNFNLSLSSQQTVLGGSIGVACIQVWKKKKKKMVKG